MWRMLCIPGTRHCFHLTPLPASPPAAWTPIGLQADPSAVSADRLACNTLSGSMVGGVGGEAGMPARCVCIPRLPLISLSLV